MANLFRHVVLEGEQTLAFLGVADRLSLPDTVYNQLREAIVGGIFVPGQMLRQEEIARQMGVSRAPLREALPRLQAEGLVTLHPRRGYSVVSLNPLEIEEIFELRALVEAEAARIAAKKRTDFDIADVRSLHAQLAVSTSEIDVVDPVKVSAWFALHARFHDALLSPSKRTHFIKTVANLRSVVDPYIRVEILLTGELGQSHSEHTAMTEAFTDGNGERLAELTILHCQNTARRLMKGLAAKSADNLRAQNTPPY